MCVCMCFKSTAAKEFQVKQTEARAELLESTSLAKSVTVLLVCVMGVVVV